MIYRIDNADLAGAKRMGQGNWWRSQLPEHLGRCINDTCKIDEGLTLAYADYHARHDLLQTSLIEREGRALTVTVALQGESSTLGTDGQRFDFVAGYSTVTAFSSVRGERRFPSGRPVRQLRLIVEEALLQRYQLDHLLDGVRDDHSARHLFFGKHGAASEHLAQTLVRLHGQDGGLLDLQIAALSLLSEQIRPLRPAVDTHARLRADDQQRIVQARDIMMRQYHRQLTVAYLCKVVGTNEFKLKQGFRELFGATPHRLLTDIRMTKAWELLETGMHAGSVAVQVGYRHLSSFSAAFERYYGRTPKKVGRK